MKRLILSFFILIFSLQLGFSQEVDTATFYTQKIHNFKIMRNAGNGFLIAGAIFGGVGFALAYNQGWHMNNPGMEDTGKALMVVGVAGIISGTLLNTFGSHFMRKYKAKLDKLEVGVTALDKNYGISLRYRF